MSRTHTNAHILKSICAAAFLLALILGLLSVVGGRSVAVAQDGAAAVKQRTPAMSKVSPELWKQFTDAIMQTQHYKTVRSMSRDSVAPIVATVAAGFQTEIVMANYLQRMLEYSEYGATLKEDVHASLSYGEVEATDGEVMEQPHFFLRVMSETDGESRGYIVPGELLAPFRIDYVHRVAILHPLNHRIQHGNYSGQLVGACREVCEAAGLDFVIGSTSESEVVNSTLRNRSVAEVLTSLTKACGWQVEVLGVRGIEDGFSLTFAPVERGYENWHLYPPTLNHSVSIDDVHAVWLQREYNNVMENVSPPITDHATALTHALRQGIAEIRKIRPVIQIRKQS